jgi:hypothetical protein
MGPKIVGLRIFTDSAGVLNLPAVRRFPFDHVPSAQLFPTPTSTLQEVQAIDVGNTRRTLAARICLAVSNRSLANNGFPVQVTSIIPSSTPTPSAQKDPERSCSRKPHLLTPLLSHKSTNTATTPPPRT